MYEFTSQTCKYNVFISLYFKYLIFMKVCFTCKNESCFKITVELNSSRTIIDFRTSIDFIVVSDYLDSQKCIMQKPSFK